MVPFEIVVSQSGIKCFQNETVFVFQSNFLDIFSGNKSHYYF